MVLEIPPETWEKLNYSERRQLINKEKKKRKRVVEAIRGQLEEKEFEEYQNSQEYREEVALADKVRQKKEADRQLQHEAWLERDRLAQEEFRMKKEREEKKQKEREERERMIKEEWAEIERREKEQEERKKRSKQSKEELLEEALADIDQTLESIQQDEQEGGGDFIPWHNPFAPVDKSGGGNSGRDSGGSHVHSIVEAVVLEELQSLNKDSEKNYGTEKDKVNCPFYLKTGACRYGDRCSRHHPIPPTSVTLLIRGMYNHALLIQQSHDGQDDLLEHDESDMLEDFKEFYQDVFPELAECGKVVQFKVSRNFQPHLKGNVYVQFSNEDECAAAFKVFNGRWYAGRQLSCELCPVQKWRTAVCGLYNRQQCPKGKHCNFLHVFDNPGGAFNLVDNEHSRNSPGRGHRRHSRQSVDLRDRSQSPSHSPSQRDYRKGEWSRRRGRYRRRSYSPFSRRRYSRSPDLQQREREELIHSKRRRRDSRSHSDRERSQSPYQRNRSPRERRRRRRSSSYGGDSHSPEENRSPRGRDRHKEQPRRRREDSNPSDSSYSSSPLSRRRSLSRSPQRRHTSPSKERRHKRKRRSRKSGRHRHHHHKKHKRGRDDSSDSGDSGKGEKMKEMMDQVLREIVVDDDGGGKKNGSR